MRGEKTMSFYIYYCPKCGNTFSGMNKNGKNPCPQCNTLTIPTEMPVEEWRNKTAIEKDALKQKFSEKKPPVEKTVESSSSSNSNSIGKALSTAGYVYMVLSVLGALILANELGFAIGLMAGFFGCLFGLLLIGFSEIINLLQDIKNK